MAEGKGGVERDFAAHGAGIERRSLEPGSQTSFLLAFEARDLLRRGPDRQRAVRLQMTRDVEPAQQRRKIQCRAAPRVKRVPRHTTAGYLLDLDERGAWVLGDPPGDCAGTAPPDAFGFDERHMDASGGEP